MALNKFFRFPWATGGDRTPPVPDPVQGDGSVSYTQGWGPDYQRAKTDPLSKNIDRALTNATLFDVTTALQEYQTNGTPDWITNAQNGGVAFPYPLHARVRYTDGVIYESLAAANTALPTDGTKWVPTAQGIAAVVGLTNANVVLTNEQASHPIITLFGTLTGNVAIIVPNVQKNWIVSNFTTGAFAVTVKTAAGTGADIPSGYPAQVWSDGTNVYGATSPGRLIGVRVFGAVGAATYTPSSGTRAVRVRVQAGGGGGGSAVATTVSQCSAGAGGGAGGFAEGYYTSGFSGVTVAVGAGGTASSGGAGPGGASSFGALLSASGGGAGTTNSAASNTVVQPVGQGVGGSGSGGNIFNSQGMAGSYALYGSTPCGGTGGSSVLGGSAGFVSGTSAGNPGNSYGSGGGGASGLPTLGINIAGGAGAQGLVIVEEFGQ